MAGDTILTRFRSITTLPVGTYPDLSVTDKAEPFAILYFNNVMDLSETITTHTTGDVFVDEIITNICAYFAFDDLYHKRGSGSGGRKQAMEYMQKALFLMQALDPSRITKSTTLEEYYPRYDRKGAPPSGPSMK